MSGLFSTFVMGHKSKSDIKEKQLLYKKKNIQNNSHSLMEIIWK